MWVALCTRMTIERCLLTRLLQRVSWAMFKWFFDQSFKKYFIGRCTLLYEYKLYFWSISLKQMFQHRLWVQCLQFVRRDLNVLITQTTFACSNIGCESSAFNFSGGMFWSLKQLLHIPRLWVKSPLITQEECPDHSNNLCMFQHRLWVQCPWFFRRNVLITQTIFVCSNIGCESSAPDFSGGMSWSLKQPLHVPT